MKDPDRTIESLLAGLRDAEPPSGMHGRILDAVVARQATAHRPLRLLHPAFAVWMIFAIAITIWVPHQGQTPTDVRRYTTSVDALGTKPPQKVAAITHRERGRSTAKAVLRPTQPPGFPAPPLPLTEQEKLLLRLAHGNDSQDMNLLNRDVQAQQSAQTTQQFQQFFGMNTDQMRSESE
jgi:hypothetical protein